MSLAFLPDTSQVHDCLRGERSAADGPQVCRQELTCATFPGVAAQQAQEAGRSSRGRGMRSKSNKEGWERPSRTATGMPHVRNHTVLPLTESGSDQRQSP